MTNAPCPKCTVPMERRGVGLRCGLTECGTKWLRKYIEQSWKRAGMPVGPNRRYRNPHPKSR